MSTVIPSPVKRWPGQVVIASPLTFPALLAWQDAVEAAGQLGPVTDVTAATRAAITQALLPGLLACVERWELGGDFPPNVTAANFPATPRQAVARLVIEVTRAINAQVIAEDADPN
jgi:hypothetical protein